MKKQVGGFLAGVLITASVFNLCLPASALPRGTAITVDPINIQVNGEIFQPKDANGNDVPVFAYSGTTYAPLRALAEAYGLEVGYNSELNLATVDASSQSNYTAPNLAELYSSKTYFPYDIPSISAVKNITPTNVQVLTGSDSGDMYFMYDYEECDESTLKNYRAMLENNGYDVLDGPDRKHYGVFAGDALVLMVDLEQGDLSIVVCVNWEEFYV